MSAQFRRPLRDAFTLEVTEEGGGRSARFLSARARVGAQDAVIANAVFAPAGAPQRAWSGARMPSAPPPGDCPEFRVPSEFVPFATRTEIRPVGPSRPFAGGTEPELLAWLRLVEDDLPPDDARLIVLMDSLAPSYGAILDRPVPIPTVGFSMSPSHARARSPWILLRARTELSQGDGWSVERLDAWGVDGAHLAQGEQLRLLVAPG